MQEKLIQEIIGELRDKLACEQLECLKFVLYKRLKSYRIQLILKSNDKEGNQKDFMYFLMRFLEERRNEGLSEETIGNYRLHLTLMLEKINKNVIEINDNDLSDYLQQYKEERQVSNGYLNDMRHVYNSFFSWLQIKKIISVNPLISIRPYKEPKKIQKPFTGEQMEKMRSHCSRERDLAILEVLYSTGVRVSELLRLNRQDIDFSDVGITVIGKGNKERETYLNPKSFYYLKQYLSTRTDGNEALFVSVREPHQRLTKAGIEHMFRQLGLKSGVEKVHPHRFRRTVATDLLRAGMPLEELKEYLGHEKIDTTMIYCTVNRDNVRNSHQKYMSA